MNHLFTVAFTAMQTVFALFTQHAFGWTTWQNGYLFTYIGLLIVFMQGGVVGQLVALVWICALLALTVWLTAQAKWWMSLALGLLLLVVYGLLIALFIR